MLFYQEIHRPHNFLVHSKNKPSICLIFQFQFMPSLFHKKLLNQNMYKLFILQLIMQHMI